MGGNVEAYYEGRERRVQAGQQYVAPFPANPLLSPPLIPNAGVIDLPVVLVEPAKKPSVLTDANTPEAIAHAAVKFDGGKLRWDLLPYDAVEKLVALYTIGAEKYADNNWLKGFRWMRTVAALMRHLTLWILAPLRGEDGLDHDNDAICAKLGLPTPSHLDAVIWNAMALRTFDLRKLGDDDRPKRSS